MSPLKSSAIPNKIEIRQKCQQLLSQAAIQSLPVNLELLASLRDIRAIEEADIQPPGVLAPQPDGGAKIIVRLEDSKQRQRFTIAHEIVHTMFPKYHLKTQKRELPAAGRFDPNCEIEYLCDLGTSELLMPAKFFYPDLEKRGFSTQSLLQLATQFDCSLQATAIRMVSADEKNRAIVVWERKYKPTQYHLAGAPTLPGFEGFKPQKQLRVKFGFGLKIYIPPDKSLDEDYEIITKAIREERQVTGFSNLDLGKEKIKFKIDALPLHSENYGCVLTLLERVD